MNRDTIELVLVRTPILRNIHSQSDLPNLMINNHGNHLGYDTWLLSSLIYLHLRANGPVVSDAIHRSAMESTIDQSYLMCPPNLV